MCTNYEPFIDPTFRELFGATLPDLTFKPETFPGYEAPVVRNIIRKHDNAPLGRECVAARFGLIPTWSSAEDVAKPRLKFATHNARVETVGQLPSFKHAWKHAQFCLIPVHHFYEPCWETGKAVRWKIWLANDQPFVLAGIWERWKRDDLIVESFTMLTVNADEHAVMKHMHRPGDEKRMPVILNADDYDRWLNANPEEALRMCQTYSAELMNSVAAPAPKKIKQAVLVA